MVIDIHTHTPQFRSVVPPDCRIENKNWRRDRTVEAAYTWDDYMLAMEPADKSVVFGIAWHPGEKTGAISGLDAPGDVANTPNEATARFVQEYPDKLIGFMSLHPSDPHALDELHRCQSDLNLKGIKMGANYQNYEPLGTQAMAIYKAAEKAGLPMLFHQGTSAVQFAPIKNAHPLLVDEIAMLFPDLKIIMAHLGHPWTADAAVVVRKHPNVYADISGLLSRPFTSYEAMLRSYEWDVIDKLLFGSDFPIFTVQETIDKLLNVNHIVSGTKLPRIPDEALQGIINRDSLKLLGL